MTLLERLEADGLEIALDGEDLRVRARALSGEEREYLSQHKEAIKAELAARQRPLSEVAKARLRAVVDRLTADCVCWYRDDAAILDQLPDDALEFTVLEFLSKREWYLRQQGAAQ